MVDSPSHWMASETLLDSSVWQKSSVGLAVRSADRIPGRMWTAMASFGQTEMARQKADRWQTRKICWIASKWRGSR